MSEAFDRLVANYRMTCGACPTQYEGTLCDGRAFYFRYRHGWASLDFDGFGTGTGIAYGDDLDGCLGLEEFKDLFVRLAAMRERMNV